MTFKNILLKIIYKIYKNDKCSKKDIYREKINYINIDYNILTDLTKYDYIEENKKYIKWSDISKMINFVDHYEFIKMFKNELKWEFLSCRIEDPEDIDEFKDYIDWYYLCMYRDFTEDELEYFKDYINIQQVSKYQSLSHSYIRRHSEELNNLIICLKEVNSDEYFF